MLGIGGVLTFKTAQPLREAVRDGRSGALMLETDCPYLAPVPHRGKRNEAGVRRRDRARVADVLGIDVADVIAATTANTRRAVRARRMPARERAARRPGRAESAPAARRPPPDRVVTVIPQSSWARARTVRRRVALPSRPSRRLARPPVSRRPAPRGPHAATASPGRAAQIRSARRRSRRARCCARGSSRPLTKSCVGSPARARSRTSVGDLAPLPNDSVCDAERTRAGAFEYLELERLGCSALSRARCAIAGRRLRRGRPRRRRRRADRRRDEGRWGRRGPSSGRRAGDARRRQRALEVERRGVDPSPRRPPRRTGSRGVATVARVSGALLGRGVGTGYAPRASRPERRAGPPPRVRRSTGRRRHVGRQGDRARHGRWRPATAGGRKVQSIGTSRHGGHRPFTRSRAGGKRRVEVSSARRMGPVGSDAWIRPSTSARCSRRSPRGTTRRTGCSRRAWTKAWRKRAVAELAAPAGGRDRRPVLRHRRPGLSPRCAPIPTLAGDRRRLHARRCSTARAHARRARRPRRGARRSSKAT